jgi:hypothetical protein
LCGKKRCDIREFHRGLLDTQNKQPLDRRGKPHAVERLDDEDPFAPHGSGFGVDPLNLPDQGGEGLDRHLRLDHGDDDLRAPADGRDVRVQGTPVGRALPGFGASGGDAGACFVGVLGRCAAVHPAAAVFHRRAFAGTSRAGSGAAARRGVGVAGVVAVAQGAGSGVAHVHLAFLSQRKVENQGLCSSFLE